MNSAQTLSWHGNDCPEEMLHIARIPSREHWTAEDMVQFLGENGYPDCRVESGRVVLACDCVALAKPTIVEIGLFSGDGTVTLTPPEEVEHQVDRRGRARAMLPGE